MIAPDVAKIVEIGLKYPEIGNKQIVELFGASPTKVSRMKRRPGGTNSEGGKGNNIAPLLWGRKEKMSSARD